MNIYINIIVVDEVEWKKMIGFYYFCTYFISDWCGNEVLALSWGPDALNLSFEKSRDHSLVGKIRATQGSNCFKWPSPRDYCD